MENRGCWLDKPAVCHIQNGPVGFQQCRLSRLVTAQSFLLVKGETFDCDVLYYKLNSFQSHSVVYQHAVASRFCRHHTPLITCFSWFSTVLILYKRCLRWELSKTDLREFRLEILQIRLHCRVNNWPTSYKCYGIDMLIAANEPPHFVQEHFLYQMTNNTYTLISASDAAKRRAALLRPPPTSDQV